MNFGYIFLLVIGFIPVFAFVFWLSSLRNKKLKSKQKAKDNYQREEHLSVVGGVSLSFFDDNCIYIIFNFYPPIFEGEIQFFDDSEISNEKAKAFDWENLSNILTEKLGAEVIHDDRELFYIQNGSNEIFDKLIEFFNTFSN